MGLREQTDQQGEGLGAIVRKIAASSECHDALPLVWELCLPASPQNSSVQLPTPSCTQQAKIKREASSRKAVSQARETKAGTMLEPC